MNRSQRRLANKQKPKYNVSRAEIEKMAGEAWEAKIKICIKKSRKKQRLILCLEP